MEEAVGEIEEQVPEKCNAEGKQERSVQRKRSAVGVEVGPEGQEYQPREPAGRELLRGSGITIFQRRQGMQELKIVTGGHDMYGRKS